MVPFPFNSIHAHSIKCIDESRCSWINLLNVALLEHSMNGNDNPKKWYIRTIIFPKTGIYTRSPRISLQRASFYPSTLQINLNTLRTENAWRQIYFTKSTGMGNIWVARAKLVSIRVVAINSRQREVYVPYSKVALAYYWLISYFAMSDLSSLTAR